MFKSKLSAQSKRCFPFSSKKHFDRFQISCPKHLLRVRDLSFLPHLLDEEVSWHDLTLQQIAYSLGVAPNHFEVVICQPTLLCPEEGTHPLGAKLLQHRLANNGALSTRMKKLFSWNLSSWTAFSSNDYRLRGKDLSVSKKPSGVNQLVS